MCSLRSICSATVMLLRSRNPDIAKLSVFMPQAEPGRRDLARLLAALFHEGFTVEPPEQSVTPADPLSVIPMKASTDMFLPRALPKAVYADHPVKGGAVRMMVSQYHTLLAEEKVQDLIALVKALVCLLLRLLDECGV